MRFHGIDMVGKFQVQRVADTTADADYTEGRIAYDQNTDDIYYTNGSAWKQLANSDDVASVIPAGTIMWFYADSAPTGWTLSGIGGDAVLGVKGGSYATGGTTGGSWSTTYNHNHSVPALSTPNHAHQWYWYDGLSYTFDAGGSFLTMTTFGTKSTVGLFSRATSADTWLFNQHGFTAVGGGSTTGTGTSGTTALSSARPYARVGVLADKD